MEENSWMDYVVTVATVLTPVLIIAFSAIGWKFRQSIERRFRIEEKLRDDRIEIYNQILEPFMMLLMNDRAWSLDPATKGQDKSKVIEARMLSMEYRKTAFKLSLIGSDAVVIAYNRLMQYAYQMNNDNTADKLKSSKEIIDLLATLLLEIRRSMGNEFTKLDNLSMLEWFVSDVRQFQSALPIK